MKNINYSIRDILLVESKLERLNLVEFNQDIVHDKVDAKINVAIGDDEFNVEMLFSIVRVYNDIEQFSIKVKVVGVFIRDQSLADTANSDDVLLYGNTVGAQVVFPYVREHITSLSIKAGLGAYIIPHKNFFSEDVYSKYIGLEASNLPHHR